MDQQNKPSRSFKELKQKQKGKISDYMYLETQNFFQTNGRMPDTDADYRMIAQKVSNHIPGLRVPIEEIYAVYARKCSHIVERLTASGLPGIFVPMRRLRNCSVSGQKEKSVQNVDRSAPAGNQISRS